ncbi:hypothetical protein SAMN05216276_100239 [Streptosporangium subroseum]|uniref:Uncharacterized protein n=1 Tax=Streptosporangium subroseum TaxID=106412 RepID=A0A239APH4_9ACTN|nr:hypothetical protein [Streptosporangium subroseum]SNR96898.1 hypothetical protein SAMN05216276_100239 [Streptosporangium subroseum]
MRVKDKVVVGPAGRALVRQSKMFPGRTERMMATQVDHTHLSRKERAPATSGNLYEPAPGPGSWDGGRKTTVRWIAAMAALVGVVMGARRLLC